MPLALVWREVFDVFDARLVMLAVLAAVLCGNGMAGMSHPWGAMLDRTFFHEKGSLPGVPGFVPILGFLLCIVSLVADESCLKSMISSLR
jgi:hypothetical protein